MFEGIKYAAIAEAKEKIDFAALKFPIYRKDEIANEVYRVDAVDTLISVRTTGHLAVGLAKGIPEDIFVSIHSFQKPIDKAEFDKAADTVLKTLNQTIFKS